MANFHMNLSWLKYDTNLCGTMGAQSLAEKLLGDET